MNSKLVKTLLIVLFIFGSLGKENFDLEVGQSSTGKATKTDKFRAIRIIKVGEIKDKYLFAVVSHREDTQYEPIKMALFHNDEKEPIVVCKSTNTDACFVEAGKLTPGDEIVVAIQCEDQCKFSFQSYWSGLDTLAPNVIKKFLFDQKNKAQIYHMDLTNQEFKELRIVLVPQSKRVPGDHVKIYGNFGFDKQPTVEQHDFESQNLWKDGQGVFMANEEIKNKQLSLLIVGSTGTIYEINPQLVKQEQKQILVKEAVYQYIEKKSFKKYHISFNVDTADEYEIHLAKFSGEVELTFYKDAEMTQQYSIRHFEYMNDIKFLALASELKKNGIADLYIKAMTDSTNAVFATMFNDQQFNGASLLYESIYDFLPVHDKKIAFLHFQNFAGEKFESRQIEINLIKVSGEAIAQFRICKGDVEKCIDIHTYEAQSKRLQPADDSIIGMKTSFKLEISRQDFLDMNQFQTAGLVLVILENQNANKQEPALVSIDYTLEDQIQDLRQGHPVESILDRNQVKYFKFVNSDPAVSGVKIHVTPIRGIVQIKGSYADPRLDPSSQFQVVGNQATFIQNLENALYVSVKGLQPSNIAVTVQLSHEQAQYSSISIEESIQYTFRIAPKGAEILKANPIFKSLKFNFRASNQVHVCMLDEEGECKEQDRPIVSKNGQISMEEHKDGTNQIVIGNPSQTNFVQVKVVYHSQDYEHCQQRSMEQLYSEAVSAGDCLNFPLHEPLEDILFTIDRHDIGPLAVKVYVCYQEIQLTEFSKILIHQEKLVELCKNQNEGDRNVAILFLGDVEKPNQSMKIQISGLYPQSIVNLADGVAFNVHGKGKQGRIGTYYYHVVNLIDTFVALKSLRGNYKFFVKIIEAKDRKTAEVNQAEYDFSSQSFNFFTTPFLTIKNQDYQKSSCNQCGLLVAVYSSDAVGGDVEYSIEAFQNQIILKDHESYQTHLSKDSFVCYEYASLKPAGECNLIVQISDNNRDCAAIYLSNREYPSEQNFLVKEIGSKLTYSECEIGTYYVTVVAMEDCPYAISISNTKYSIVRAERGIPVSISLQENEVKYALFRHMSKAGFKLVTLQKYGSVDIFANKLDPSHLDLLRDSKEISLQEFVFKSSYTDTLYIDPSDQGYCSDCYYIVAIRAIRETQSSLLLADSEVPIQMTHKKILNDEILKKGDKTYLEFKNILAGKLPFQVHSGTVKATITYKTQQADHVFEKKKQLQVYNFALENPDGLYDWSPIKVNIQCIEPVCVYSVGLIDSTDTLIPQNQINVVPGTPSYLFMDEGKEQCIAGYIRDVEDDIVITVDRINTKALGQINMRLKINGEQTTEFVKQSVLNVMTISVNSLVLNLTGTNVYSLCLLLPEQYEILAIVDQGEQINLLPEDSEVLVQNQDTFIVYPEGPFLVDIFECSGVTTFKHGFNQEELDSDMSQLSTVAMPDQPHAIKLSSFLPTFLRIKSQLSIVRWLPIDQIAQRGLGYFKYRVGDLKYQTSEDQIKIMWGSVTKFKDTNTSVSKVDYKLFISDNIENLKSAASCEKFIPEDVIAINLNIDQSQALNNSLSYDILKDVIGKKFKGRESNIYINLVADMSLRPPLAEANQVNEGEPEEEYYRFLYHVQQIPKDVFAGHQGQAFNSPIVLAAIAIGASLAVVVILYIILKRLIPMISRMKSRMMLEEEAEAKKDDVQVDPVIQSNERIVVDDA